MASSSNDAMSHAIVMPAAGTLKNLKVRLSDTPGYIGGPNRTITLTVVKSTDLSPAPTTAISCQLVGNTSNVKNTCSDATHSLTVTEGDLVVLKAVASGTNANSVVINWSLKLE
jgi:3-oxoacyl-[acyl-carrier-protein] synthase III